MLRTTRQQEIQLFNAQAATGVSSAVNVSDYRHVVVAVTAPLNATLTFKFMGAVRSTSPTFSSAQSTTNVWDYVGVYDLNNNDPIVGDTGVALNNDTAANNTRQYLINTDHLTWFALEVSAYTYGSLSAWLMASND